jgi:hypothetical protein
MAGDLTKLLHGNLHRLSDKNFKILTSYYEGNILTSEEENSLRNEIMAHRDMSRVQPLLD